MAVVKTTTISATGTFDLHEANDRFASTWVIMFTDSSFSGTGVTVEGRVLGSDQAFQTIAYLDRSDGSTAATAITTNALIEVNATGLEVRLNATVTSGSLLVEAHPVMG